jgi:hypothetical protein
MTQEDYRHPIAPAPELVQQWRGEAVSNPKETFSQSLATRAAKWGADQELEACCEVLDNLNDGFWSEKLRAARRPKPPSLKQQALKELAWVGEHLDMPLHNYCNAIHTIQRALEQLPDAH